MSALIFIDTNIMLDFYRIKGERYTLSLLKYIDSHHDKIITSSQVEMEYKKNRQRVITQSLNSIKAPDWGGLSAPAFLCDAKPIKAIKKNKKEIVSQLARLKKRTESVLNNPSKTDPVYRVLQRLFKNKSKFNLSRENKDRFAIRRLARKRFMLGYPPRKSNDISLGDAINWEWIIQCAVDSKKDIVIVSRDSDYGISYSKKSIINDWLLQEFKSRVSKKKKLILTDSLSEAFKLSGITIPRKEKEEEKKWIGQLDTQKINSALKEEFLNAKISDMLQTIELLRKKGEAGVKLTEEDS